MIQKMKKLTFLVYHKEYQDFLHRLQDLGVMHIESGALSDDKSAAVEADMAELRRVEALLKQVKELPKANDVAPADASEDYVSVLEKAFARKAELAAREKELAAQIEQLTPWGEFDPEKVRQQLDEAGCKMSFYTASTKAYAKTIATEYPVVAINDIKGLTYFVAVTRDEELEIPATAVTLPEAALSDLQKEYDQVLAEQTANLTELQQLAAAHSKDLTAYQQELEGRMSFDHVCATTETVADDHLMVLHGWVPADQQEAIQTAFATDSAWFEITDPQPDDDIPVCLKNNRFFSLFEMITELYMLPKYNELDLTPFFAPFYVLFFGLCLGDSGYGLFITLGVLAAKFFIKDMSKSMKAAMNLLLTMGISAFLCGLLSGAFFGFNLYELNVPLFDKIGNVIALDNSQMFNLSLILGFIQIIFGMCLKAYNRTIQFGFPYALSTIGWMMIILSLAASMFLPEYAAIAKWFTIVGFVFALGYNSPDRYKKNPATGLLINVGAGLWDAYNTATGMLGDMLSYVRLFALGLSGGILATVFDSLATGLAPDNAILGPIVMVLIFVIGHALNMFMNVLGAFVHPMRLTFVEFFKNAGYEGGGTAYNPFRK
ncbi:MAG: V-type ATP synthase subunit I [Bacteroidaceae bacterium]|nr:V-type ATP synthase subunit I [Bacteroidaceae bacterium]